MAYPRSNGLVIFSKIRIIMVARMGIVKTSGAADHRSNSVRRLLDHAGPYAKHLYASMVLAICGELFGMLPFAAKFSMSAFPSAFSSGESFITFS